MKKEKNDPFAWNRVIQELSLSKPEQDEPKERLIRINLTHSELERIMNGETIQTQYSWLSIGKALE